MMLADDWVQLWLYIINEAYICIHLTRGIPRCFVLDLMIRVCEVLHRQNQSVQKTPFSICSFLPAGKWSHEATIHLLKPFTAMMSVGRVCYAELLRVVFFDLRFIRHHPHPFLRAMNPIDRLEEDNRWLSRER